MIGKPDEIVILCSGMTLGVYTPAITVNRQLLARGLNTRVEVFENLFSEEKRNGIKELKLACHRNFRIAKIAQKIAVENNSRNLGDEIVENLVGKWLADDLKLFVVFSGYWMPIIKRYMSLRPLNDVQIYIFHMDTVLSSSWKPFDTSAPFYKHIWLFEMQDKTIPCYLQVDAEMPKDFHAREKRVLIHGGGWGIGTYKDRIKALDDLGFGIDIIAYEEIDVDENPAHDYYLIDTDWSPWEPGTDGVYTFPPLKKVEGNHRRNLATGNDAYPEVYNIVKRNKAIISKPGGGTLVDSFSSATPLIMLEPYGEHEEMNAKLWCELGMGILYQDWVASGYSFELLERLHSKIISVRSQKENVLDIYFKWHRCCVR